VRISNDIFYNLVFLNLSNYSTIVQTVQ